MGNLLGILTLGGLLVTAAAQPCRSLQLAPHVENGGVASGTENFDVVVKNRSNTSCRLQAFPKLTAMDTNRHLAVAFVLASERNGVMEPPKAGPIVLEPGQQASFQLGYKNGTGLEYLDDCSKISVLHLHMQSGPPLKIAQKLHACGDVQVSFFSRR